MESLTSDVTAVRGKVKAVKDQLQSCRDVAFNSGVAAFLQARLHFLCSGPYAVVTCEIKLFQNNFEIISVFYFTCNH